jgi:hypothetical protein
LNKGGKKPKGEANAERAAAKASGGSDPVGDIPFIGLPVVLGGKAQGHQTFGRSGENSGKLGELAALRSGFWLRIENLSVVAGVLESFGVFA